LRVVFAALRGPSRGDRLREAALPEEAEGELEQVGIREEVLEKGLHRLGPIGSPEAHQDDGGTRGVHFASNSASRASIASRAMPRPKKAKRLSPCAGAAARVSTWSLPPTTWKRVHPPSSTWTMPLARKIACGR